LLASPRHRLPQLLLQVLVLTPAGTFCHYMLVTIRARNYGWNHQIIIERRLAHHE
jgi:hypothetical protein